MAREMRMCHYEGSWRPLAIHVGDEVVGHVMWVVDPEDGSYWIGGLVIHARHQRAGRHGRAAVGALLERFRADGAVEAALSYQPDNAAARALYASLSFRETGERAEGETVGRRALL